VACLEVPELRAALERSNLPEEDWARNASMVDDMCGESGVDPTRLGIFTEFSQVEAFQSPNGVPAVTKPHLLAVLGVGLILMREAGVFRKRTDVQSLWFSEFGSGTFLAQESVGGHGWGYMVIQAMRGSVPLFRLGWYFDERSSDSLQTINAAANERDRILTAIERAR
jgi:hypothetical protein